MEKFLVRVYLTLVCLGVSLALTPFMMILKVFEGIYVSLKTTFDSIESVWSHGSQREPGRDQD